MGEGKIFDNKSLAYIIVFWASWCGPCRSEIPEIKEIYKKYKNSKVDIINISIDENTNSWKKALVEEKMP